MSALSQTPGSVIGTSRKIGTAGATITAGMPVYRDGADSNKLKKCQANAAGTANCHGIALTGSSSGQPIVYQEEAGDINLGATLTVGESYYVSDAAAGAIIPAADLGTGDYVTLLGVASSASNLKLQILNSATAHA